MQIKKLSFSGHDTFHCRQFWLKKGYDFKYQKGRDFKDDDAVVELGVGKNMVNSIKFWLKAFGFFPENSNKEIAHLVFSKNGKDPYLEDIGSVWLLHYLLVSQENASIYSLVFNEFRKEKIEFTRTNLLNFLKRKCESLSITQTDNILNKDIGVFLKNYLKNKSSKNIEDDFSGLFLDLNLLSEIPKEKSSVDIWYKIESKQRKEIPIEIILFAILDQKNGDSIRFDNLRNSKNSIGNIFAINEDCLLIKIQEITEKFRQVVFTEDAGIRELQFKEKLDKMEVLKKYYGN